MCDQQSLRSACAYAQSDQSLCKSLEYSMTAKLLTENIWKLLSFKRGCTGSSESTLVTMPHCWKSHATAHIPLEILLHGLCIMASCLFLQLHEYKSGTPSEKTYFVELWDVGGCTSHENSRSIFYNPVHGN